MIFKEQKVVEQLLTVFGMSMNDLPDDIIPKDTLVYITETHKDNKVTDKKAFINALSDFRKLSIDWVSATINENSFAEAALDKAENDIDFINEIIQNADDCNYDGGKTPTFTVSFGEKEIVIHYNEIGMTWSDIVALTSYGYSNKNAASDNDTTFDKTTIGEKGIGFKFIFKVCNEVEIYSNGFNFKLYQREYQGIKDLGFIPEWNDEPSKEYLGFIHEWNDNPSEESKEYMDKGTTIILRDIKENVNTPALFSELKKKYSKDLCANPVLFTKKLHTITAKRGTDVITCTRSGERSGDFGMESETKKPESDGNAEIKDVQITMNWKCDDKSDTYSYNLRGISHPVLISKEAVEQRYKSEDNKIEYNNVYRRIFIFAAFKDGKLQTNKNEIGGTMYSYLPTAEELTVPLIIQLPVRLDKERMHIFFDNKNPLRWNDDVLDDKALGEALKVFFEKMSDLLIKDADKKSADEKEKNFEQLWRLLPRGGKLFDEIDKKYETVYNEAPCFYYSLSEEMISRNNARMLDPALSNLEEEYEEAYYRCCGNPGWHIISYDRDKEGIFDSIPSPDKEKIMQKLIDEIGCQDKLFEIWNAGEQSVYLPELESWVNQLIFPAAVDNNGAVEYKHKPLTDGIWFADKDKKLTSPENCFLHFYHGDENGEIMKKEYGVKSIEGTGDKKEAVLEALADMVKRNPTNFPPTYEQLRQLAQWGFDGVNEPLDVWKDDREASKAEGLDISDTESTKDTTKQSYFAKITAWYPYKDGDTDYIDIDALSLLIKAYLHKGFENNGFKNESDKTITPKVKLPRFGKWTPELCKVLNTLPFGVAKKSFELPDDCTGFNDKDLEDDIKNYYELDNSFTFYFFPDGLSSFSEPDGNEPKSEPDKNETKYAAFFNTVVFFDKVNSPKNETNDTNDTLKCFIADKMGSNAQIPTIQACTNPIKIPHKDEEKTLLCAIREISEFGCRFMTQGKESGQQVENDPISELLQNADDSKLRSGEECTNEFEVNPDGNKIILRYTEKGFSVRDFYCITHRRSTGNNKQGDSIGHFGTGFRSVYTIFNRVEVQSRGYLCILEPYDKNSDSSVKRYKDYITRGSNEQQTWRKNYLSLQPIPIFTEDAGQNAGETTITLYPKDESKVGEIVDDFQEPKRYVFLDRLGSRSDNINVITYKSDEKNGVYVFTSNRGKEYLTYTKTLVSDTAYPSYLKKDLKREPSLTMTVRFGEKPDKITPYYCGLPLEGLKSHLYCYVNVPAFIPNDSRKNISDNVSNKDWNYNVLEKARLAIGEILEEYAHYYYYASNREHHYNNKPPYYYLSPEFFKLPEVFNGNKPDFPNQYEVIEDKVIEDKFWNNELLNLKLFPAWSSDSGFSLCSVNDIRNNNVYILPKKFFEDIEENDLINALKKYKSPSNDMPPTIYSKEASEFLYTIPLIGTQGNAPASLLFFISYPGKTLYRNLPDLPEKYSGDWISAKQTETWRNMYGINDLSQLDCIKGLYEDGKLCEAMFTCFKSNGFINSNGFDYNDTARNQIFDAAENISNSNELEEAIRNDRIPIKINKGVVLLDRNSFYVRVQNQNEISSKYAVQCHEWVAGLTDTNILTNEKDFERIFTDDNIKNKKDILNGCTEVFLERMNDPIEVKWDAKYAPILRTYCTAYSSAAKNKGQEILIRKDNGTNAPTYGLLFSFSENLLQNENSKLGYESLKWLENKFTACVDSNIVKWEDLNEKCLIVQNSSYDGYAWQNVGGKDKIVLFCRDDTRLPEILQRLIKKLFDTEVILGERLLEDDDYMLSKHNGAFSEEPDNIKELIQYYVESTEDSPPAPDNDFYLIGTWDFQLDGKWHRYRGYGSDRNKPDICGSDKSDPDSFGLPSCPVCGGKLLAHRKSCKIEYVSVVPKSDDTQETFHIPVLMCSTCSDSMKYYYSVTLEAEKIGDVIDAIKTKPDNLRICFNGSKDEHRLPFRPTVYHRLLMLDIMGQIDHNTKQDCNSEPAVTGA